MLLSGIVMSIGVKLEITCVSSFSIITMRLGSGTGGPFFLLSGTQCLLARLAPELWEVNPNHGGKKEFYLLSLLVLRDALMYMANILSQCLLEFVMPDFHFAKGVYLI